MATTIVQHFETVTIPGDELLQRLPQEVSRWVVKGALLVTREDLPPTGKDSGKEIKLELGDHVEQSGDGSGSVLAAAAGYPKLTVTSSDNVDVFTINLEPMVEIDSQAWLAKLTVYPAINEADVPSKAVIEEIFASAGVRYGIRTSVIDDALQTVADEMTPVLGKTIARGRLPVNGKDGYLRLEVEVGEQPGLELGDGGMNYKERNLFVAVAADQLLATRIPATQGLAGISLYGQEVLPLAGKELEVTAGTDTIFNQDTGEIRAATSGIVSVAEGSKISVTAKSIINGDIDYTTGNITSTAAVDIRGNVKPGFSVFSEGNLFISGRVESAQVTCLADAVIASGVTGEATVVKAGGNLTLAYVEQGRIHGSAEVVVRKQIYYARISARHDLRCQGQTKAVGSWLCAGHSLYLGSVDRESSSHSMLAAAVDWERLEKYLELLELVDNCERRVRELLHRLGPGASSRDIAKNEKKKAKALQQLEHFNLVPVGSETDLTSCIRHAGAQRIFVTGEIQAGAVVRIGNIGTRLGKNLHNGSFQVNHDRNCLEFTTNDGKNSLLV